VASRILNIAFLFAFFPLTVFPQTGGDNVYEFLNLTRSALVASIGGTNVSLRNGDLNLVANNPSLLSAEMNKNLTLNYVNYLTGINYGMTMYSISFPRAGNFAAGITYLNYGTFKESDESGNITGSFTAAEYALSLIWSKEINTLFSAGISFSPILSHLEKYTSFGIAFDIGASWHSINKLTSAGVVIRNAGFQITTYTGEEKEDLPFEIQAGLSHHLKHAPLRFSITLRHLEKFDLTHDYSSKEPENKSEFAENLLRHFIAGVELIPHKNFYFSAGYNYQRRKELEVESNISTTGLSWGFGINTTYLNFEFGRAAFHLAGASNYFTLVIKPGLFLRKNR